MKDTYLGIVLLVLVGTLVNLSLFTIQDALVRNAAESIHVVISR